MRSDRIGYRRRLRSGFATLLVLLVIAALSLAVYAFANQTFLEHSATRASIRQTQARWTALSGIDALRSQMFAANTLQFHQLVNAHQWKEPVPVATEAPEFQTGVYRQISRKELTAGLQSESARLNLNALDLSRAGEVVSRTRLVGLPNVTPQMADALLDWMDADDEPRTFGAEANWYADNAPQARPTNGPIRNLHQLTFIRGFDELIVFGEDTNNNGWLDWNEDDGDSQLPSDNGDGVLNLGLAQYISLNAFESNIDALGNKKINLNNDDLFELHAQVSSRFGESVATFIAAYRLDGPVTQAGEVDLKELRKELDRSFDARIDAQLNASGERRDTRKAPRRSQSTKGGVALERSPLYRIASVVDLIGVSVITLIDDGEKMLTSPWELNGADAHDLLLKLEDAFTVSDQDRLPGRIDINQASLEVLRTIPGLSHTSAQAMVATRERPKNGAANDSFRSIYWLLENKLLSLEELRRVAEFITVKGAIYSGYAAGHDRGSQSSAFIKFTLCQEGASVRLLEQCEVGFAPLMEQDVRHDRSRFP
ncbi:MAG: type II secretion system protein GspK [Pirellulaceae bacterium]|nr:type II secretion system protein GspK [Pirellulaceae bacterium]